VRNRKPAGLAWSAALANITPLVTAKTTNDRIPGDQLMEETDVIGYKDVM